MQVELFRAHLSIFSAMLYVKLHQRDLNLEFSAFSQVLGFLVGGFELVRIHNSGNKIIYVIYIIRGGYSQPSLQLVDLVRLSGLPCFWGLTRITGFGGRRG